ncbi:hypothetical protein NC653_039797 [Populus alba x Populus x berolinensis]|uniref:Uncharacterized protein n=1 Tax=Populus alba x Populus x berolinensis TaxID=444605 RepID=A0AAD6PRS2_9ROSI|nr:hypothetical protein NC653_039797 [Populus alba x Populus x berolinensis]
MQPLIETMIHQILVDKKFRIVTDNTTEQLHYVQMPYCTQYLNFCKELLFKFLLQRSVIPDSFHSNNTRAVCSNTIYFS